MPDCLLSPHSLLGRERGNPMRASKATEESSGTSTAGGARQLGNLNMGDGVSRGKPVQTQVGV